MDGSSAPRNILHVIDQASPQSDAVTLAWLAELGEPVLLVGGTPLRRRAEAAGLVPGGGGFLSAPAGHAGWGVVGLRRWFARRGRDAALHAWSLSVLSALRWIGHGRGVTLHLTALPDAAGRKKLRRLVTPDLKIETFGQVLRQRLIDEGLHADRVTATPLWSTEAAEDRLSKQRAEIRAAWNVEDHAPVVALLGDPPAAADASPAMTTIDLVGHATGRKLYLLVHPFQAGRDRTQTVLDAYRQPDRMVQDARLATPWRVLAGCDAVLMGRTPAVASARFAVAAGLPIVAPDKPSHREALADAERAYFAATAEPKRLAHQLQHQALRLPGVPHAAGV
ncbi:MAG: hypothetical protein AAF333_08485 [Planctomycetota bacterium]